MIDPPSDIKARQAEQVLEITWPDGGADRIPYRVLRAACPCAACKDEFTGERIIRYEDVREDVRLEGLETVGSYAVKPFWNDGHSTGIYTWEQLRETAADSARS